MDVGAVNPVGFAPAAETESGVSRQQRMEQQKLIHAVEMTNSMRLLGEERELTFSLDRQTHRTILRVVDRETKEVVEQIPPEYVLRLAREAQERERQA